MVTLPYHNQQLFMKTKIVFILSPVLLLFSLTSSSAQEQRDFSRFEVSASTGLVMTGLPKGGKASSLPLEYDLTFAYFPKSWLSVGLSAGNSFEAYFGGDFFIVLTPAVKAHWFRRSSFTAYSGIGYAIPIHAERLKNWPQAWYEGFQYIPIGVTFGRSFYGLAELGFGPRYFPLRLGVGYRF